VRGASPPPFAYFSLTRSPSPVGLRMNNNSNNITNTDITAVILSGGQGSRMGGLDKGLQPFRGHAMAMQALLRLQKQTGGPLAGTVINANRNLAAYESMGVPVWPDTTKGSAGPLAGMLTGLAHCDTPWLLTVPCDSPLFPLDLARRLAQAASSSGAQIAMVSAPEADGQLRAQPVFCLISVTLRDSLVHFMASQRRKIDAWTATHHTVLVPFNTPGDDPLAFFNANTLADLHHLANSSTPAP
jgi:molybdenum cofactor guanylyltransferase